MRKMTSARCVVCGGYGGADARRHPVVQWETMVHQDPRVCARNLARMKEDLEAREAAVAEREKAAAP